MPANAPPNLPPLPIDRSHPLDPPPELVNPKDKASPRKVRTIKGDPAWLVTNYDQARSILRDKRFSSSPLSEGFPSYISGNVAPPPGFFMQHDAPDHARVRSLVAREFLPKHITGMRSDMERIIEDQLSEFAQEPQPADLVSKLAYPVAAGIIGKLLGIDPENYAFIQATVDQILDRSRTARDAEDAAIKLMGFFSQEIARRRNDPRDDLVGRIMQRAVEHEVEDQEIVGAVALLFLGGYDTMVQIIGLGTIVFINAPEKLEAFSQSQECQEAAIDELVRYLSVNHAGLPRAAMADVTIGDTFIRKGEGVLVMINAANRDPEAFDNPSEFDPDQNSKHHLGFGHGLHKCIGAQFARAELALFFPKLFAKFPTLHLSEALDAIDFRNDMVLYGATRLPVRWDQP